MNRRDTVKAIAALGATTAPLGLLAQARPGNRPFRIGFPYRFASDDARSRFVAGMREFGWREKQDYLIVESGLPFDPARAEEGVRLFLAVPQSLLLRADRVIE